MYISYLAGRPTEDHWALLIPNLLAIAGGRGPGPVSQAEPLDGLGNELDLAEGVLHW